MPGIIDLAHEVQPTPEEVFDYWWETERGHMSIDAGRDEAREAFDLGRSYVLTETARKLAKQWVEDRQLRARRVTAARNATQRNIERQRRADDAALDDLHMPPAGHTDRFRWSMDNDG